MTPYLNPDVMSRISALSPEELKQFYKPELPDDADDRFNLNLTVGERRVIEWKAKTSKQSVTQFILSQAVSQKEVQKRTQKNVAFSVHPRKLTAIEEIAQEMRFDSVEDLMKELVDQVIGDPEMADEFLFGKLRKRLQKEAQEELQHTSKSKRVAA